MNNELLQKLQTLELMILEEIDRICVKHNITYFLAYGTLIGAVRHGGFIPWDDDIDLFMPRDDYEHFLKVCPDELNEKFLLHYQETDPNYPLAMTKVRLKNTFFCEKNAKTEMISNGIWIDIFSLENVKKRTSLSQKFQFKTVNCINTIKGIRLKWDVLGVCSTLTKVLYYLLRPFSVMQIYRLQEKLKTFYRNKKCDYMVEFSGCYGQIKQTFKKTDLFPPKRIVFSGMECYIPNNSHNILSQIYGEDYMTPPSEDKRKTHNPTKVDLGPYAE